MKQLLALLFIIGAIGAYFWYLVTAAVIWVAAWLLLAAIRAEHRRRAGLVARADQQHTWVLCGDSRGTYGDGYAELGGDPKYSRTADISSAVRGL